MRWIATPSALLALVVLVVLSAVLAPGLARRSTSDRSSLDWFVALAAGAPILALTLFRGDVPLAFEPARIVEWSGRGLGALSRDPLGSSQFLLNVALFVPAGAAWTWVTGRPWRVLAGLAALSLGVEIVQALTGSGANDLVDLVANVTGAGSGVLLARATGPARGRDPSTPRRRRRRLVGLLVVSVVLLSAWIAGASQRQDRLAAELTERFADTTRAEVEAALDEDPEAVFGAVSVRADGMTRSAGQVIVRYPATFFSLHRCVLMIWEAGPVEVTRASGDECTRFLG